MTFDHSLVWEMEALTKQQGEEFTGDLPKNYITRCLGVHPEVVPDIEGPFPLQPGDTYLLCSDGLSGQVNDAEIGKILFTLPPAQAVQVLRDLAILRGGPDNITVVVAKYLGPQQAEGATAVSVAKSTPVIKKPYSKKLAFCSIIVLLCGICAIPFSLILAAVFMLAAILLSVIMIIQRNKGESMHNKSYGNGPYKQFDARPDAEFAGTLIKLIAEVRPKAKEAIVNNPDEKVKELWNSYLVLENKAKKALSESRFPSAVRNYAKGLHFLMDHLGKIAKK